MKTETKPRKKETRKKIVFLFGIIGIILCLFVFVLFIFQKKTYVTADLFISGGEWWWVTADPPYWLSNPVVQGASEYDLSGKKIVEVLQVEKFDQQARKTMLVRARLLVTKNFRTRKLRFKQIPLEIGSTIVISPGNIGMYANVVGIEGIQDISPQEEKVVVTRWYNVFPWQADAIHVGDVMKDGSGNVVAEVLRKDASIAEKTIVTENNQLIYGTPTKQVGQLILLRADPLRRDVTLEVKIKVRSLENQMYFGVVQNIKIGETLFLSLPDIFINPTIISLSPPE